MAGDDEERQQPEGRLLSNNTSAAVSETEGLLRSGTLETEPSQAAGGAPGDGGDEERAVWRAKLAICSSHFLSTWGQRGWEFCVGLVMLELHPSSLLFVSLFGLLDAAGVVLLGASVGGYVDRTPRLRAACQMYLLQNAAVAASAAAALALLWSGLGGGPAFWALLAAAVGGGCLSSLGSLGSTLSVEREWTKALCAGNSPSLARLNAAMKRIDLTCLIASPIMVGLVMGAAGRGGTSPGAAATLALLAWNMLAWAPECALLRYAAAAAPALRTGRTPLQPRPPPPLQQQACSSSGDGGGRRGLGAQLQPWRLYFSQPALPAALALSLLYLTVMSWGTLMTAYLKWLGLGEAELAVYRGLGALSGIAATLAFPPLQRAVGLVPTGVAAIWAQLACVVGATAPSLLGGRGAGEQAALVGGLVASRFGLWAFDLAANQLLQETVQEGALGAVSGAQGALQSLFQLLAYAGGVALPQPQRFPLLMAGSCASVGAAAALFSAFALRSGCGRGLWGASPPLKLLPLPGQEGAVEEGLGGRGGAAM